MKTRFIDVEALKLFYKREKNKAEALRAREVIWELYEKELITKETSQLLITHIPLDATPVA